MPKKQKATVAKTPVFGANVFHEDVMREYLSPKIFKQVQQAIAGQRELDPKTAQVLADAMKTWAIGKGATHFTHWFQPMTGFTAEKHDSFFHPTEPGKAIMKFSYKELIKGESDASSFPSGGLRATFEARGYTVWDMTSPVFLKEDSAGTTLCIPTAFCSYNGEALDKKTPLLRSMEAVSKAGVRLLHAIGQTKVKKVIPTVGPEQEYFLIRREDYEKRPDIVFTGRTLFGARPPKGQEMEDHYFATIREPIGAFMKELDEELWKVGVSARTRHNEVAPSQHELAPMFAPANIACDHNQIIMETMKRVAARHGFVCLLHEKPFAHVNGSGKHNNWSLGTDTGLNLFEPGSNPAENDIFLIFLSAVIQAVHKHAALLRVSAATPGNDHRLGANEAPPAIISVYLGAELSAVLNSIAGENLIDSGLPKEHKMLDMGATALATVPLDSSDRNRTSPFAFTGNKFEFRMVPSTASIAAANFTLNTIVAEALDAFAERLEKAASKKEEIRAMVRETVKNHGAIIFNGNNYSAEWVAEAARRGLPNLSNTVDAADAIIAPETIAMYEKFGVLSKTELTSRHEIVLENYIKTIRIEGYTLADLAYRQIAPAALSQKSLLADAIGRLKGLGADSQPEEQRLTKISHLLRELDRKLNLLTDNLAKAETIEPHKEKAVFFRDQVLSATNDLRKTIDALEENIEADLWPFPTIAEILYHI